MCGLEIIIELMGFNDSVCANKTSYRRKTGTVMFWDITLCNMVGRLHVFGKNLMPPSSGCRVKRWPCNPDRRLAHFVNNRNSFFFYFRRWWRTFKPTKLEGSTGDNVMKGFMLNHNHVYL